MPELYFPCFFRDWNSLRSILTPEQGWRLFLRCLDHAMGNELSLEDDPLVIGLYVIIIGGIDRSIASCEEKTQKRRYARYCGACKQNGEEPLSWEEWFAEKAVRHTLSTYVDGCQRLSKGVDNQNQNQNPNQNQESESNSIQAGKPQIKKFIPPSLEEVREYFKQKALPVDPEKFYAYYAAGDWVDSNGKPVLNWKQKALTWQKLASNTSVPRGKLGDIRSPEQYHYSEEDIL